MIITIAQNMYNCSNQQPIHCAQRVNFMIFKYCSYSKSKLLELTQPKYKKHTLQIKNYQYIFTHSYLHTLYISPKVCIGNLCHSINLITAYVHKKTSWCVLNTFITYYMKLIKTFKLTEPIWYEKKLFDHMTCNCL